MAAGLDVDWPAGGSGGAGGAGARRSGPNMVRRRARRCWGRLTRSAAAAWPARRRSFPARPAPPQTPTHNALPPRRRPTCLCARTTGACTCAAGCGASPTICSGRSGGKQHSRCWRARGGGGPRAAGSGLLGAPLQVQVQTGARPLWPLWVQQPGKGYGTSRRSVGVCPRATHETLLNTLKDS